MNPLRSLFVLLFAPAGLSPAPAQEMSAPDVPALIRQLGAPRVRLRDEAEAALRSLPAAVPALQQAAASGPGQEVRLRAAGILTWLQNTLWTVTAEQAMTVESRMRTICASPDGRHLVSITTRGAQIFDAVTAKPLLLAGRESRNFSGDWGGVRRAVAVSPDNKLIASGGDSGAIYIDDFEGRRVRVIGDEPPAPQLQLSPDPLAPPLTLTFSQEADPGAVVWGLRFLPDGKHLLYVNLTEGLVRFDLQTGEKKILPLNELRPRSLAVSADGRTAALGTDPEGLPCRMQTVDLARMEVTADARLKTIPNSVCINRDGTLMVIAQQDGSLWKWRPASGMPEPVSQFSGTATCVVFSPGEAEFFATGLDSRSPLKIFETATGAEIWSAPPADRGFYSVAVIDAVRIATAGADGSVRIWNKRVIP